MPNRPFPLVGVTGGIGSGKSAVCRCFKRLGRVVLSADSIARDLTETNPAVRDAIAREFGQEMYGPDGGLRRSELARIVFAHPAKLRVLNSIVHPVVFSALNDALARLPADAGRPYAVVEAALIFESGMDRNLDATVVVAAPEDVRVARVVRRDSLPPADVIARMRAQIPSGESSERGDFVIDNSGAEEDLAVRIKFIDTVLALMFTVGKKARPRLD
jgi:dephospho-CoA kinase